MQGQHPLGGARNIVLANRAATELLGLSAKIESQETFRANFEVLSPGGDLLPVEQWPTVMALRGEFLHHRDNVLTDDQISLQE